MAGVILTDQEQKEAAVLPQYVPSSEVRLAAVEQALKFTMENIQVQIQLPSNLVGVPPQVIRTNLYQVYLEQLTRAKAAQERQQAINGDGPAA